MCRTLLVIQSACQKGHIMGMTACWRQCTKSYDAALRIPARNREYNRLCDGAEDHPDANLFQTIDSHAKMERVRSRSGNCSVCQVLREDPRSEEEIAKRVLQRSIDYAVQEFRMNELSGLRRIFRGRPSYNEGDSETSREGTFDESLIEEIKLW